MRPIDEARERYDAHGEDFDEKFAWHLENGWVVSVPYLFAMGNFYGEDDKVVCFVEACVGSISELLRLNLFNLDFLEFQRNFSGQTRRYSFERFTNKIK